MTCTLNVSSFKANLGTKFLDVFLIECFAIVEIKCTEPMIEFGSVTVETPIKYGGLAVFR